MNGWKTYLGAFGFGVVAVYYLVTGDTAKGMEMFLAALAILGLRHALGRIEAKK